MSKLQLLITKFKNLRMANDEHLLDIAKESFALKEKIYEEKLVRKAHHSLPKKFYIKLKTSRR